MIKNIVFDIGGVLIDFDPAKVLEAHGLSGAGLKKVLDATINTPLWKELDRGVMNAQDVIDLMKKGLDSGLKPYADWFFSEGMKTVVSNRRYSAQWLKYFKDRGFGVYLLSNYPVWAFEMHSKQFDFMQYIDGKVVSGYVKVIKPDAAIYNLLLNKYQLKADECIFIDDVAANAQGAKQVGMHAVQFSTYSDVFDTVLDIIQEEK